MSRGIKEESPPSPHEQAAKSVCNDGYLQRFFFPPPFLTLPEHTAGGNISLRSTFRENVHKVKNCSNKSQLEPIKLKKS